MPTPFPGMDPYLERRGLWEEVHAGLIVAIRQFLTPLLRPHYRVAIERRTYLALVEAEAFAGKPDIRIISPGGGTSGPAAVTAVAVGTPVVGELPMPEEVVERYLEVRDVVTGEVVTVIEILSPMNKLTREGGEQYERKRLQVLGSATNLVEMDLLRAGTAFPVRVRGHSDYRIIVSRSSRRPQADVYLFNLRDPIPDFPVPLRPGHVEPVLPLNQILHDLYERAGYDLAIDYGQPPEPPVGGEDAEWVKQLLDQKAD